MMESDKTLKHGGYTKVEEVQSPRFRPHKIGVQVNQRGVENQLARCES